MSPRDRALKISVPFEDALRRILKAGPMPKRKHTRRKPPGGKRAPTRRG